MKKNEDNAYSYHIMGNRPLRLHKRSRYGASGLNSALGYNLCDGYRGECACLQSTFAIGGRALFRREKPASSEEMA